MSRDSESEPRDGFTEVLRAGLQFFMSGGPHFTTAGKPIVAKVYGDYYSTEP